MARPRTTVTVEVLEPGGRDDLERRLLQLADSLEDFQEPLLLSIGAIQTDIRERFKTGMAPDGDAWANWKPKYRKFAENHSKGHIFPDRANLYLTGDMYRDATHPTAYITTDDGLFLDTTQLPHYWAYQQFGRGDGTSGNKLEGEALKSHLMSRSRELMQRMRLSPGEAMREAVAEQKVIAKIEEESGDNPDNTMPARPFIGLTTEGEAKVVVIFDRWFNQEIEFARSSKGKMFGRHSKRGPSGRFAPL